MMNFAKNQKFLSSKTKNLIFRGGDPLIYPLRGVILKMSKQNMKIGHKCGCLQKTRIRYLQKHDLEPPYSNAPSATSPFKQSSYLYRILILTSFQWKTKMKRYQDLKLTSSGGNKSIGWFQISNMGMTLNGLCTKF